MESTVPFFLPEHLYPVYVKYFDNRVSSFKKNISRLHMTRYFIKASVFDSKQVEVQIHKTNLL